MHADEILQVVNDVLDHPEPDNYTNGKHGGLQQCGSEPGPESVCVDTQCVLTSGDEENRHGQTDQQNRHDALLRVTFRSFPPKHQGIYDTDHEKDQPLENTQFPGLTFTSGDDRSGCDDLRTESDR